MDYNFDVTVVGAGPAGCILAYELAKAGVNTLVIEKEILPRYKCCAGGITGKAAKNLPIDINSLIENRIVRIDIGFRNRGSFEGQSSSDLIYTVRRDRFDYALAGAAEKAGATLWQGNAVTLLENNTDHVIICSQSSSVRSKFVVGADGARSFISRAAGFQNKFDYIAAINAEIATGEFENARWRGRVFIDVGFIEGGYAWVFPKSDHVAVGIATILPRVKKLNTYFNDFLKTLEMNQSSLIHRGGALIPLCKGSPRVVLNRVVLVGDAAGLADPLSGEGIDNAVKSSRLAANVILNSLEHGTSNLGNYQKALDETIMPEIKIARVLQKLFVHFPQVAIKLLNFDEKIWRACCRFASGDLTYSSARERVGGYKGMKELFIKVLNAG